MFLYTKKVKFHSLKFESYLFIYRHVDLSFFEICVLCHI